MRVLYIVSRPLEINSSASLRNITTINGLANAGHNVDVLTSKYDINHSNYSEVSLHEKVKINYIDVGGIKKLASFTRRFKVFSKLRRALYKKMSEKGLYDNLQSIVNFVPKLDINNKQYDLVISSSDPKSSHLFTLELFKQKKLTNVPWIQIWGDPFVTDINRNKNNNEMLEKIRLEENRLLENATKIVYVSFLTLLEQQKLYPKLAGKMQFIPRPYEKEMIYPEVRPGDSKHLSLVYCGDYSTNIRNIIPLYNSVVKTGDKLTVCGNSNNPLESTENISVSSRVPYRDVLQYEGQSDVLVHLSNLSGTQTPGKIYHYSSTNKPILFILDGDVSNVRRAFEHYDRYIFCENNENSIIEALNRIKRNKDLPAAQPLEDFSIDNVVNQILQPLNTV